MLFHLDFRVEYSAEMSQNNLFDIWSEEAKAAVGAKEAGVVVDLWKAVGDRRVIAIVNVESMLLRVVFIKFFLICNVLLDKGIIDYTA